MYPNESVTFLESRHVNEQSLCRSRVNCMWRTYLQFGGNGTRWPSSFSYCADSDSVILVEIDLYRGNCTLERNIDASCPDSLSRSTLKRCIDADSHC